MNTRRKIKYYVFHQIGYVFDRLNTYLPNKLFDFIWNVFSIEALFILTTRSLTSKQVRATKKLRNAIDNLSYSDLTLCSFDYYQGFKYFTSSINVVRDELVCDDIETIKNNGVYVHVWHDIITNSSILNDGYGDDIEERFIIA